MCFKIVTIYRDLSLFIFYMSNIVTLLALLAIAYSQTNISTLNPTWVTSPFFRAGYQTVISTMTGSGTQPQFTFTFSSSMQGIPSLAYGIKNYRGNDYFGQQFFQIRNIGLTPSTFSVEVQIYGITNIHILSVTYIAVEPNFPHHLNSFDNVPLNYSSGNIVNISIPTAAMVSFTEIIDYRTQTTGRMFTKFTGAISNYKIVLFITSLWIRGTWGSVLNPVQIHIYPTILNQTHYQWIATAFTGLTITKLQFSEIIFNQKDVESSLKYFIVYEQWISDMDGGFRAIPQEFVDNFIMAVTDFQTVDARCGFQYQWEFQTDAATGLYGIRILRSWTLTNTCGFSWARSSIFYMKTWKCDSPTEYFNLTTNLCQNMCHPDFIQNSVNLTCDCEYGYDYDGPKCSQICGDGVLFDLFCDDGNLVNGDGCSSTCTIEPYFTCTGGSNVTKSICTEVCGDGRLFVDQCDDGNTINGDGCSSTCKIQPGYVCPGGTPTQSSACKQICGDGIAFTDACDDGNLINGDGCSSTCTIEPFFTCSVASNATKSICTETCGDGRLFIDQCDDGNTVNGDGCSSSCKIQVGYTCSGGSSTQPSTCKQICGDGMVIKDACDDGNLINGDGCSSTCTIQTYYSCSHTANTPSVCKPICGDGYIVTNKEQCDDKNIDDGDGCSSTCTIQIGYACVGMPSSCYQICGDGILVKHQCDDGNLVNGDGCSSACGLELGYSCVNMPSVCWQACGDGRMIKAECDDGNRLNGDGCDQNCKMEDGYDCIAGNLTSKSICESKTPPSFDLHSFYKDPNRNAFTIQLKMTNLSPNALANIQSYLNFNFPYQSVKMSVNAQTGIVTLDFTYNETLNSGQPLQITYTNLFKSSRTLTLPQTTDNNLTLKLYDDSFYQTYENLNKLMHVLSYLILGSFIILFLTVSKLIAIEMIFVFQFIYCGLVMLKKLESLMEPYKILWITNSYNEMYTEGQDRLLPPRITAIFYKAEFFSNFNLDVIIFVLPVIVGLSFYVATKFNSNKKLTEWGYKLLKEWQLSAMLFCEFQLSYALVLCIKYGTQKAVGVFFGVFFMLLLVLWTIAFIKWPHYFGQYKYFFNQTTFGQNFYVLIVIYRIVLSFSMISFSETIAAPVLAFILSLLWAGLLFWKMPYKKNIRPISNSIVMVIISVFYIYTRDQLDIQGITFATYLPFLIVILIVYTFFLNLFYFAKHFSGDQAQEIDNKVTEQSQIIVQGSEKSNKRQEKFIIQSISINNESINKQTIQINSKEKEENQLNGQKAMKKAKKVTKNRKTKKPKAEKTQNLRIQQTNVYFDEQVVEQK